MTFVYISTDLGVRSSGGTVAKYELEALKSLAKETNDNVIEINYNDIHPKKHDLPDNPLFIDLLALDKLNNMDLSSVKLVHMYGGSYLQTIRMLKSKGIKTTNSLMFHNRETSISEHEKFFGKYPYAYVKDDKLWNLFIGGIREADVCIASGKHPADNMLKEGAKRVEIIPLGCDIPSSDKIKQFPTQFTVGYLGEIGPDKGLFYLIKAWELLGYPLNNTLIFAGRHSEQLANFIRTHAKCGNFNILGYVEDVSDFYNNISVYVQPSATEGFALEVPESMSYGRPVICSDGAGAADLIENESTGFIVPRMDINAIAEKIDWFKNHLQEMYIMGGRSKSIVKNYTWQNTKDKYIKLWKSLLHY
jgi:glycosyltransferase involved in cell wall biosynthesis